MFFFIDFLKTFILRKTLQSSCLTAVYGYISEVLMGAEYLFGKCQSYDGNHIRALNNGIQRGKLIFVQLNKSSKVQP